MNTGILTLFFLLPAPLKVLLILGGGFMWFGIREAKVEVLPAQEAAPKAAEVVKPKLVQVTLIVGSDGSYTWDGAKLTAEQLDTRLKKMIAAGQQPNITLKADALTPHQMLQSAMQTCKKAGVKSIQFSAKAGGR